MNSKTDAQRLKEAKEQAIQNVLKSKESRRARDILAQVSTHHEAFKVARSIAEDQVEAEFTLANKKVSLWTKQAMKPLLITEKIV